MQTLQQLPKCIALALGAWFLSGVLVLVPALYVGTRLALARQARARRGPASALADAAPSSAVRRSPRLRGKTA